jgi:hypothetical protein
VSPGRTSRGEYDGKSAYMDAIRMMALVCVVCIPIIYIARRNKPGAAAMGH